MGGVRTGKASRFHRCIDRTEVWAVWVCILGALLVAASTFLARWRVDEVGTAEMDKYWYNQGFETKTYGLLRLQGAMVQSWSTVVTSLCQYRNYGQVMGGIQSLIEMVKNKDWDLSGCKGSEQCAGGFITSIQVRCQEYEKMWQVSTTVMVFNFVAVVLTGFAAMLSLLTDRRKTGGLAFGMFLFAGAMVTAANAAWALVTDGSFKRIMETAWYPYPTLGIAYFVNLYGGVVILAAAGVFGFLVVPEVWNFDPEQEELDERKRKLKKLQVSAAQQQHLQHRQLMQLQSAPLTQSTPPFYNDAPCSAPPQYGHQDFEPPPTAFGQAYPPPGDMTFAPQPNVTMGPQPGATMFAPQPSARMGPQPGAAMWAPQPGGPLVPQGPGPMMPGNQGLPYC